MNPFLSDLIQQYAMASMAADHSQNHAPNYGQPDFLRVSAARDNQSFQTSRINSMGAGEVQM